MKVDAPPVISKSSLKHYRTVVGFPFQRVCRVRSNDDTEWYYEDIDQTLMFSPHRSWTYAIVVDGEIVKFGESGNPLGIRAKNSKSDQPIHGTKCRLGRYRKGGDCDYNVRMQLLKHTNDPNSLVEIWAIECAPVSGTIELIDGSLKIYAHFHKQLEKILLDYFKNDNGTYPLCNTGRY